MAFEFHFPRAIEKRLALRYTHFLGFHNPEFKILADFNILAFQNPEFKILADFKILAFQNPEFKILAEFKIFYDFKILAF